MSGPITRSSTKSDEAQPNTSKHGHMGWDGASYECYLKVISRSQQCHISEKG